ncbi:MAG: methylated-DNA--[protein]-cysteine S-methyltransferase [Pseudonocardia sp.]
MGIAWATVAAPAPVGALTVLVGAHGLALVRFGADEPGIAAAAGRLGEPLVVDPAVTGPAVAQLGEYLDGHRRVFELPLDWRLAGAAARPVLRTLHDTVPYGATVTYGELAARSGLGTAYTAARGVGAIMGANPLPVVVPCHRVLAAGGLGGFGGGRAVKEWLLALEGVLTPALDLAPAPDLE